jgi:hypothetical protein
MKLLSGATAAAAMTVLGLRETAAAALEATSKLKVKITKVVANPAYFSAEFEDTLIFNKGGVIKPAPTLNTGANRYDLIDGKYVPQPYFKEVTEEMEVEDDGSWRAMDAFADPAVRKVQTDWPDHMGGKSTFTRMEIVQKFPPGGAPKGWVPITTDQSK